MHWVCVGGAILLLAFSFFAFAVAASAQESEAFNQASPAAQQAIRDARAMDEEAKQPWKQRWQDSPIVEQGANSQDWNRLSPTPPANTAKQRRNDGLGYGLATLLAAAAIALVGRGARYILADE